MSFINHYAKDCQAHSKTAKPIAAAPTNAPAVALGYDAPRLALALAELKLALTALDALDVKLATLELALLRILLA